MKQRYGMDEVLMLHFDRNLLELPWKDFAEEILINRLQAVHVVCGHDYSFGYLGLGTPQLLREVCAAHGVGCSIIEKVEADGSSHIADRSAFVAVQTPQVFDSDLLKKAYEQPYTDRFTDDASVVQQYGERIDFYEGSRMNIKITDRADLKMATLLQLMFM